MLPSTMRNPQELPRKPDAQPAELSNEREPGLVLGPLHEPFVPFVAFVHGAREPRLDRMDPLVHPHPGSLAEVPELVGKHPGELAQAHPRHQRQPYRQHGTMTGAGDHVQMKPRGRVDEDVDFDVRRRWRLERSAERFDVGEEKPLVASVESMSVLAPGGLGEDGLDQKKRR